MSSFAVEIFTQAEWVPNSVRLTTQPEAEAYGDDCMSRMLFAEDHRVVESPDAPNYRWDFDQYKLVAIVPDAPVPIPSRSVT